MRTFFEENRVYGSSFLIYGNVNDDFYCPDMTVRKLDQYLVSLLKSRGYERIIFYGTGGTRGAYCLDAVSARFFMTENKGIALPEPLADAEGEQSAPAQSEPQASRPASAGGDSLDAMMRGRGKKKKHYVAGDFPEEGAVAAQVEQQPQEPPRRIRYSLRQLDVERFIAQFRKLMMDPNSRMAMVFYNVATDYASQNSIFQSSLKDDILVNFSQTGDHNLCLIVAPETESHTGNLQHLLQCNGLGDKFLQRVNNGGANEYNFNPDCCFRVGYPTPDEIQNMLHRFAVVGLPGGKRIRFDYGKLEELAERILANSARAAQRDNAPARRKMRAIAYELERYIYSQFPSEQRPELTLDLIDDIWNVHVDPQEAMKKLGRKGWEKAQQTVQAALRSGKNAIRFMQEAPREHRKADMALERYCRRVTAKKGVRPPIPNFILLGNPGTGKTQIARLIGQILYSEEFLRIGHTVPVTREKLTNSLVAGVPKATMQQVDNAEEGVLFIDEAHSLGQKDGGVGHDGTGVEVIQTLNAAMTDPDRHFSVILAGYEKDMEAVFDLDPGFRSRFEWVIRLDDYKPELLFEILLSMIKDRNYTPDPSLVEEHTSPEGQTYIPLRCMVERIYAERDRRRFGNARVMEDLVTYACAGARGNQLAAEAFCGGMDGKITPEFFIPMDMDITKDKVFEAMDEEFVGMASVKEHLRTIARRIEYELARGNSPESLRIKPIVLVGNPGTGKTSVANKLPQLLYQFHILGTSVPLIRSASELASSHSGGTQEKVMKAIRDAQDRNALLYIDEAHELCNPHFDGHGAFQAFMAPTTDAQNYFVPCFGVYPTRLEKFLELDPGGASRFDIIRIEDYKPGELLEIFLRALKKQNYTIDPQAEGIMSQVMTQVYLNRTADTGNARKALDILRQVQDQLHRRCELEGIPYTDQRASHITARDIPAQLLQGVDVNGLTNALDESGSNLAMTKEQVLNLLEQEFVGMDAVKEMVHSLALSIERKLAEGKKATDIPLEPIVLVGNPGTGKTTVAELLPKLYYHYGLLGTPVPVKCSAQDLGSSYVNGSQEKAREIIAQAQNSRAFLFVDEAHELNAEALKSFMAPLTDRSRPFVACFAVYDHRLEDFLSIDPGSRSRLALNIHRLPDYKPEELYEIFLRKMAKLGYTATEETLQLLKQLFSREYETRTQQTGNARFVENILKEMQRELNFRCDREGIPFSSPESRCFTPEDIPDERRKGLSAGDNNSRLQVLQEMYAHVENARVGNEALKEVIRGKLRELEFQLRYPDQATAIIEPGHYFFKGNPGTGKSTSLDLLAELFCRMGLVKFPKPVRMSASHLIGQYLGQTGVQTREALEHNLGRVILIDEAYALSDSNEHANSYKRDAINEIVAKLDDETFRKTTYVVFAGYEGDMDALYRENEGLRSRVKEVAFPDFTLDECVRIMVSMLQQKKTALTEEAYGLCCEQIALLQRCRNFANGRTVRDYVNLLDKNRKARLLSAPLDAAQDPEFFHVCPADIPAEEALVRLLNL